MQVQYNILSKFKPFILMYNFRILIFSLYVSVFSQSLSTNSSFGLL